MVALTLGHSRFNTIRTKTWASPNAAAEWIFYQWTTKPFKSV